MVALYFLGFPSLIVIGLVLLIAKRPLRLSWTAGLIPTLYAMPYSLELILKEQRWGSVAYHTWWNTYAYNKRAIYFIRLALESIAQCILVVLSDEYYAYFKVDACRADKSIAKLARKLPLNGLAGETNKYLAWLCSQKKKLNINSHSTVQATRGDHVGLMPTFGPSFDHNKADEYQAIQKEFRLMTNSIEKISDWMKE